VYFDPDTNCPVPEIVTSSEIVVAPFDKINLESVTERVEEIWFKFMLTPQVEVPLITVSPRETEPV